MDTQIYNIEFSADVCNDSDFTLYNLQLKDDAMKAFVHVDFMRYFRIDKDVFVRVYYKMMLFRISVFV